MKWYIKNKALSAELVIIILYPASTSRIVVSLKAFGSPTIIPVQNGLCRPFFLRAVLMLSAHFIAGAFLNHIRTLLGTASIWNDSLWSVSQWKCWKSDIRGSVLILYNYPPKGRWIVVDVYRDAKRRGIYPPLFTDPEGDSCFSIYQISWIKKCCFYLLFWNFRERTRYFSLRFAKQWISKDNPSYGSQSQRAKIAIH